MMDCKDKENSSSTFPSPSTAAATNKSKLLRFASTPYLSKWDPGMLTADLFILQRIAELRKAGLWWERRLPKVFEPPRAKVHWDYLLEEMTWMAQAFDNERKWKIKVSKKRATQCVKRIQRRFQSKQVIQRKAEKDEEVGRKKTAGNIAKMVRQFWANAQTLVEYKEQTTIDSIRKLAMEQKLSFLVNETEKYSKIVAQTFTSISQDTGIHESEEEGNEDSRNAFVAPSASTSVLSTPITNSPPPPDQTNENDGEFNPPSDSESDIDDTIAAEEANEKAEDVDHSKEIYDLEAENNMSLEELIAKYYKNVEMPVSSSKMSESEDKKAKSREIRVTRSRAASTPVKLEAGVPQVSRGSRQQDVSKLEESTDESDSTSEKDSEDEDANVDLTSLLSSTSSEASRKNVKPTEEETNKLADLAESFKPKGNTLSTTTVVTKVPHILRHQLREYQHIGLDWLVAMHDKKLNGILADEMGLGKTIQTIALLAYLAVERQNWGPHLIIVPTSVMLNWELELMKWCPGFKILTYYGTQKERKLKRSGWTRANTFHVCITSYQLVTQDNYSFRRKKWQYLILDEAHNIKNFKSQRWQLLLNFKTQRRLLLTGTPLQNNLMELWSLLHFLMPNVFQSHTEFKDWFSNPMAGMVEGSREYNEDIVRRLHKVLRPFLLRRMKSEVEKQLPQKYEHVVMCSLSKRQRFLYDEFMSRSKTKDTLIQGSLLSVISVLMQLRKVCNHPNLFEPRPIASPLQTEGLSCDFPAVVWDVVKETQEDSFCPLFTISNPASSYDEIDAKRIEELMPLFVYNPDEETRHVVITDSVEFETGEEPPPRKLPKRIVNLAQSEPPPFPRVPQPLKFFMGVGRPGEAVPVPLSADCLGTEVVRARDSAKVPNDEKFQRKLSALTPTESNFPPKEKPGDVVDALEYQNEEDSTDGSLFEEVRVVRKRKQKAPPIQASVRNRLKLMGWSASDFKLDYIEERKLQDRKAVVDSLNKLNRNRCIVSSVLGPGLIDRCQVVGSLPQLRLASKKIRGRLLRPKKSRRDFKNNGYFGFGLDEIMKIIRIRGENEALRNHPYAYLSLSKYLDNLVATPDSRMDDVMELLKRFLMYIPAVSAPPHESYMYRPVSSRLYFKYLLGKDEYRNQFGKRTEIVHPIVSRMQTQFPDPRLIQYDCGKLQTLDKLLRKLKTGNHRILIFTQMSKMLDILELFLNYNGHTYLRLDGATKIDQRQLLMEKFNGDKRIFCFILSTRSGGVGVNLTGADTVIFYDSDWNPTMDAQAQDRCHRIGQTRDVHIYRLVSEKTVEENILIKSNQKRLLGELAIEGGKFTTSFFQQHTIRDLFTVNEKKVNEVLREDNPEPSSGSELKVKLDEEEDSSSAAADVLQSPEKKRKMQMIECALAAAEDDQDIEAAQIVHAEAEAEMAEFDENVSIQGLDSENACQTRFESEFQNVYKQMTDVERYALHLLESTIDDWAKETVAQVKKDIEEQKLVWELQQKAAQENNEQMEVDDGDDDSSQNEEELPTSSSKVKFSSKK